MFTTILIKIESKQLEQNNNQKVDYNVYTFMELVNGIPTENINKKYVNVEKVSEFFDVKDISLIRIGQKFSVDVNFVGKIQGAKLYVDKK